MTQEDEKSVIQMKRQEMKLFAVAIAAAGVAWLGYYVGGLSGYGLSTLAAAGLVGMTYRTWRATGVI